MNRNTTQGGFPGELWELDPQHAARVGARQKVGVTPVRVFVTPTTIWVANYSDARITALSLR